MEEIKRDLSELNCDKMLIHPNSPKITTFIEEKIISIRAIRDKLEVSKGFTKAMVYRYIMLMYSPNSPIRNMMALDWFEQKFEACAYAGFELKKGKDGYYRFDQEVVDMIMGKNNVITDMIVAFIGYLSDEKWGYVVFLKESMLAFTRDAIGKKTTDYKNAADFKKLYDDYMRITSEMSKDKEETDEFVNRFYYNIEQARLAVRPENYAQALNDGSDLRGDNPYGVNYVVDKIRFLGDDESRV